MVQVRYLIIGKSVLYNLGKFFSHLWSDGALCCLENCAKSARVSVKAQSVPASGVGRRSEAHRLILLIHLFYKIRITYLYYFEVKFPIYNWYQEVWRKNYMNDQIGYIQAQGSTKLVFQRSLFTSKLISQILKTCTNQHRVLHQNSVQYLMKSLN